MQASTVPPYLIDLLNEAGEALIQSASLPSNIANTFDIAMQTAKEIQLQAAQQPQVDQSMLVMQELQGQKMQSEISKTIADAELKKAQAQKINTENQLLPIDMQNEAAKVIQQAKQTELGKSNLEVFTIVLASIL